MTIDYMGSPNPNKIHRLTISAALLLLRGLRLVGRLLGRIGSTLAPTSSAMIRGLLRYVALPIYKTFVIIRLRTSRLLASTHGLLFLLFTNRYVIHAAVFLISIGTILTQLQPKSANATEPSQSLLYALVTNGQDEIIEETVRPETLAKNANYLGATTIEALPDIDYDYETDNDTAVADLTVPGSIAVQPTNVDSDTQSVAPRTDTETYVVQANDTVASIAQSFGVNAGTIIWANHLDAHARINPGDSLKIPPVSGVLHTIKKGETIEKIAKLYGIKTDDIYSTNHITPAYALAVGEELVIPGASPLAPATPTVVVKKPTTNPVAVRTGIPVATIKNKSFDVYQELTNVNTDTRIKPPDLDVGSVVPANKLLWPSRLHVINQYYGWKHTGVDIEGDYTDPIYAAEDGVVETAGWNTGGYGLQIIVNHENGLKTRYAHASKLFVQVGDRVKRGEVMAMIGTTGRSTGTHLHFEVYNNGKRQNPLAYVQR